MSEKRKMTGRTRRNEEVYNYLIENYHPLNLSGLSNMTTLFVHSMEKVV